MKNKLLQRQVCWEILLSGTNRVGIINGASIGRKTLEIFRLLGEMGLGREIMGVFKKEV